jgi:hypothetical protein
MQNASSDDDSTDDSYTFVPENFSVKQAKEVWKISDILSGFYQKFFMFFIILED